jgi:cold shock CspA family protein
MERGKVITWNEGGYGFIRPERDAPPVFVHQTNILMNGFRRLNEGDLVEFSIGPGHQGRGTQAVKVRRL